MVRCSLMCNVPMRCGYAEFDDVVSLNNAVDGI